MNEKQLEALLKRFQPDSGNFEEDLLEFGKLVIAETKRLRLIEDRRLGCQMAGGHHFNFTGEAPSLEFGNGKITVEGWRNPPAPCLNCDGELGVTYREKL